MWFKNLQVFWLEDWPHTPDQMIHFMESKAFQPTESLEAQSVGWVPPREQGDLVYTTNNQHLLNLRTETKVLPTSVVNQVLKERVTEISKQQGYRVGRKQTRVIKEQVIDYLLPKAFVVHRDTFVWIDPINKMLVIDSASQAKVDSVITVLVKTFEGFSLKPWRTNTPARTAMTAWVRSLDSPGPFTIDQNIELTSVSSGQSKIKFVETAIDNVEAQKYIDSGRDCTQLSLTWNDRVSFVLTDHLEIKRVQPLDILSEGRSNDLNEDERFESDFWLMVNELCVLIDDLNDVLGGMRE